MADIRPFSARRFTEKAGDITQLTCPPYDIISESQRLAYLARNPHNIVRLELPREGEQPYETAGETFRQWTEEGILQSDPQESFYVYEMRFEADGQDRSVAGLIARVHLEDFSAGVILPHEETLSKAKADRFELMKTTHANFSQIYALYTDDGGESETLDVLELVMRQPPLQQVTDESGVTHTVWALTDDGLIGAIQKRFTDTKLYIADGHHRYETALHYRDAQRANGAPADSDAEYVMMLLVEMTHPGLTVFPTHRLVRGLAHFDPAQLLEACRPYFEVRTDIPVSTLDEQLAHVYAQQQKAFGFYTGGDTCALLLLRDTAVMDTFLPALSPASRQLDVNILHTLVLERLLGIDKQNMANQTNLTYTRNWQEALDNVQAGIYQCSFLLNATRVTEIRDVAAAGEKMPQKSTYFHPKPITGLIINGHTTHT